jgi:hypothetical protein
LLTPQDGSASAPIKRATDNRPAERGAVMTVFKSGLPRLIFVFEIKEQNKAEGD